jgi:signal transduction histidine kinase
MADSPRRVPWSGRLWVSLTRLLALTTLLTGTLTVLLYGSVLRERLERASPATRSALIRDLGLPPQSPENPVPIRAIFVVPIFLSIALGSVVCLVVALVVARRFVRPLEQLTATAQRIAQGDLGARAPVLRGPSELAVLIEDVNRMAARLEHFDAERRAESAAIAHELRTPLSTLRMRVVGLEQGVYPLEVREVSKLHRQIGVLSRLADDLQTLTLADTGRLELARREIDLGHLAREVIEDLRPRLLAKQLEVAFETVGATHAHADPERLGQVFYNLLENAARYTPDAGRIALCVVRVDGFVRVTLENSGVSLDAAQVSHLFERFYRAEASRARESGGSGLGLAVVRAVIEGHGGRVWARAVSPDGLEVGFELPG